MDQIQLSLLSAFAISLLSFVGALTLVIKKNKLKSYLLLLVGFSAGALMGGALMHLMPEAIGKAGAGGMFELLLVGFVAFFLMEKLLYWRHCHDGVCKVHPFTYLNLIGDAIHNFIDGIVLAASFSTGTSVGIVSTMAIAFHEIPQELGDFGVLLYGGMKTKKALFYNFLSALTAVVGVLVGSYLFPMTEFAPYILAFAAGNFLYIASSDLIPELHKEPNKTKSMMSFATFLAGIGLMYAARMLFG